MLDSLRPDGAPLLLLLKATVKKTITVPGYTKADGQYVHPHQKVVNVDLDKTHDHIVAGNGTYSQKKAHAKLSKLPGWADLPDEHKALHIQPGELADQLTSDGTCCAGN